MVILDALCLINNNVIEFIINLDVFNHNLSELSDFFLILLIIMFIIIIRLILYLYLININSNEVINVIDNIDMCKLEPDLIKGTKIVKEELNKFMDFICQENATLKD